MLRENAQCVECMDKSLCFLLMYSLMNITSETLLTRSAMLECLSSINVSDEQTSKLMCEIKIDPNVLPFIACVIRMTAFLQASAVFLRIC